MPQNAKKYVIAGLDKAGKTSILLSLQGVSNLLSYYSLRPTLGVNVEQFFDKQSEISIWDLGGQEEYRKTYIDSKKLKQFFDGMKKCIYVIDVQDQDRYKESLQYLSQLYPAILKANPEEIIIFFHKFDPDLASKTEYTDERIRETLIKPIQAIFINFKSLQFYKSTIFTIFQKSKIF